MADSWRYREGDIALLRKFVDSRDERGVMAVMAAAVLVTKADQQEVTDALAKAMADAHPDTRTWWVNRSPFATELPKHDAAKHILAGGYGVTADGCPGCAHLQTVRRLWPRHD